MDYTRPFKAVFADPRWLRKMAVTAIVSLVPILNLTIYGYFLAYQRAVAEGHDDRLPEWDDLGGYWVVGLQSMVAAFVYAVPIMLVGILVVGGIVAAGATGGDEAAGLAICGIVLFYGFVLLASLFIGILYMAMLTHFNVHRTFGAFFRFGEVWRIMRANAGAYFGSLGMTWVLSVAVSIITSPITAILSFAMVPTVGIDDPAQAATAGILGLCGMYVLIVAIMVIAYVPMYHLMFHYFGQYMGIAYGMRPNEPMVPPPPGSGVNAADAPEPVLPPPPPSGVG